MHIYKITFYHFKVFFVDYGRKYKVENCNIRQFDEKYSVLPFQAILFQIGNVQYDKDMDDKKNECIQTLTRLLQAPVLVPAKLLRILNGGELIEVRLYDKSGEDIGEMLINEGYVKPKF